MKKGAGAPSQHRRRKLSNHELLAILLRTGTKKESVLQLSSRLLQTFDGLRLLKEASAEELSSISGIGRAKAVQIWRRSNLAGAFTALPAKTVM